MAMIRIRKEHAGDAAGRTDGNAWSYDWPQDGAVVEVPYEVALEVLAIPHGGFTVAEDESAAEPEGDGDPGDGPSTGDSEQIEEPAPEAPLSESPPPRAAKKTAAKKTTAPGPTPIEE